MEYCSSIVLFITRNIHKKNNIIVSKHPMQCSKCSMCHSYVYYCHKCNELLCCMHYNHHKEFTIYTAERNKIVLYNCSSQFKYTISICKQISEFAETISYHNSIYFTGGVENRNTVNYVKQYLLQSDKIVENPSMKVERYLHSLCKSNSRIYCIGGSCIYYTLSACEYYNIPSQKWISMPPMTVSKQACAAFIWKDYIYTLWGVNKYKAVVCLVTVEKLQISLMDRWSEAQVRSCPDGMYGLCSFVYNDKAYVIGGNYYSSLIGMCYELSVKEEGIECTSKTKLLQPSSFSNSNWAISKDGNIFAVDMERNIHMFTSGKWTVLN